MSVERGVNESKVNKMGLGLPCPPARPKDSKAPLSSSWWLVAAPGLRWSEQVV